MKYTQLLEHDGESLATTLERGKTGLNDWYKGFYAGFHGEPEPKECTHDFCKGHRRGKSVANQKING